VLGVMGVEGDEGSDSAIFRRDAEAEWLRLNSPRVKEVRRCLLDCN